MPDAAPSAASDAAGRLAEGFRTHRYAVLFYTLLATLGVSPLLTALQFGADLLQVFLAFSLLVAVLDVPGPRWRRGLLLLAAIVIGLRVAPPSAVGAEIAAGALAAGVGIAVLATASAMRFALRARVIRAEHVYAALSAYLLAGQFFGVLYWALATVWPGRSPRPGRSRLQSGCPCPPRSTSASSPWRRSATATWCPGPRSRGVSPCWRPSRASSTSR